MALVGAHVGGQLEFNRARLANPGRTALAGHGLTVDQEMFCRSGFIAEGDVFLPRAHVGGRLDLSGTRLRGPSGKGLLDLESVEARDLTLPSAPFAGRVNLTDARAGQLHDPAWAPPPGDAPYVPVLAGFEYQSLGTESADRLTRLDWIAQAEEGYLPHAYDQLIAAYRRAGSEEDAREVAIAKQRKRRDELAGPSKWWNYFFGWTVGYGYRTWRAIFALVAIVGIGWAVFAWASWDHLHRIKSADQLPEFQPSLYSIDAVLPVINLGQESAWSATGAAQYWYAFSVLAGWILATALIAALTATLNRD